MNFLKSILFLSFLFSFTFAKDITPTFVYTAKGGVTDIIYNNNKIYASTTASTVDIFDLTTKNHIDTITLPKIKDFMGDEIDSKLYSIDIFDDSLLILSQGNKGGRTINIYKDSKLHEIISDKKRMFIAKAKFLDKNTIVFALLSNEVFVFDLNKKRVLKTTQISYSKFSNFALTEDKKSIIIADESGDLQLLDSKSLKLIKTFKGQNLDNVFQVDTKNGLILTAGQDRRTVVYDIKYGNAYHKDANFLIYSAGLSPSARLAGFASNEQNDVTIFDTKSKMDLHTLIQNPATITNILFINEKEVFVTSDHEKINYYKID